MHKEILNKNQLEFLLFLKNFSTAIALYLGHRRSIDFDLFYLKEIDNLNIQKK